MIHQVLDSCRRHNKQKSKWLVDKWWGLDDARAIGLKMMGENSRQREKVRGKQSGPSLVIATCLVAGSLVSHVAQATLTLCSQKWVRTSNPSSSTQFWDDQCVPPVYSVLEVEPRSVFIWWAFYQVSCSSSGITFLWSLIIFHVLPRAPGPTRKWGFNHRPWIVPLI